MPTELHPIKPQGTTEPPAHGRSPVIRGGLKRGSSSPGHSALCTFRAPGGEKSSGGPSPPPLLLLVAHCYVAAALPMIDSLLGE